MPAIQPYINRSPFGSSSKPSCPSEVRTIRSDVIGPASPTEWSSRSWLRFWCSDAPTKGSPTSLALRGSESTLCRRRNEWIEPGLMEKLREISLGAYDRLIGLELSDLAVDG